MVSQIFVDNHSVFDLSDPEVSQRFAWAYRLANRFHVATNESVIRREILVREGECYDVERVRDSERLLRALGFIADVDIYGVRQADSTVHVVVDTRDEWSLRVDGKIGGGGRSGLTGARLREANLLGTGMRVSTFYFDRPDQQVYGASYYTPQLFGTRWDAGLEVGRTPFGYLLGQSITYPYVGETGRWAFRQAVRRNDSNFEYRVPRDDRFVRVLLPESRLEVDLGGVYRRGAERHNRTVFGAVLRGEWLSYPAAPVYASLSRRETDPPPELGVALDTIASVRAMALVGQRNVYFVRRRGLDTVRGTEDVRLGVEAQVALGPSLPVLSDDRDLGFGLGFFAAGEVPSVGIGGVDLLMEARRNYDSPASRSEWSDVFGHLAAWSYLRRDPEGRDLVVASLSAIGGWHVRVPYQLTLGSEVGLRGYPDYLDPGARRVVASLEHRRYLGWPLPELFDLGTAAFVDVGRAWAGDAPFGVDSPVRASVGLGLRAAFPPGSRQALRLDLGVPLEPGAGFRDLVLTVGVGQWIGRSATLRDSQLNRSAHLWSRRTLLSLPAD